MSMRAAIKPELKQTEDVGQGSRSSPDISPLATAIVAKSPALQKKWVRRHH